MAQFSSRTSFWEKEEARLLGPFGAFLDIPMEDEAVVAYGPAIATTEAIRLLVLGHREQAHAILDDFLPRLKRHVIDKNNWPATGDHPGRHGEFPFLAATASVAQWIRDGFFDPSLTRLALDYLAAWANAERPDGPQLLHLMLAAVEADDESTATTFYELWEKSPLDAEPKSFRFSNNARHVLFLCIRANASGSGVELAVKGLERFKDRATKWEKGYEPVPYVGIFMLARLLSSAYGLLGMNVPRHELWRMLK